MGSEKDAQTVAGTYTLCCKMNAHDSLQAYTQFVQLVVAHVHYEICKSSGEARLVPQDKRD